MILMGSVQMEDDAKKSVESKYKNIQYKNNNKNNKTCEIQWW